MSSAVQSVESITPHQEEPPATAPTPAALPESSGPVLFMVGANTFGRGETPPVHRLFDDHDWQHPLCVIATDLRPDDVRRRLYSVCESYGRRGNRVEVYYYERPNSNGGSPRSFGPSGSRILRVRVYLGGFFDTRSLEEKAAATRAPDEDLTPLLAPIVKGIDAKKPVTPDNIRSTLLELSPDETSQCLSLVTPLKQSRVEAFNGGHEVCSFQRANIPVTLLVPTP